MPKCSYPLLFFLCNYLAQRNDFVGGEIQYNEKELLQSYYPYRFSLWTDVYSLVQFAMAADAMVVRMISNSIFFLMNSVAIF